MQDDSEYVTIPLQFNADHCRQARQLLGWSVEQLAQESGVSTAAIEGYEAKTRALRVVTRQALAFRLESEGLVFFDGHQPLRGDNVCGCTPDPALARDFNLIE
ncbi:MAG: helix-turn-helix transcriptional regulator [Pseudomonas sp.]|nr:helix-turn-helix transcriptional regulator [Pseudomonas sp.]